MKRMLSVVSLCSALLLTLASCNSASLPSASVSNESTVDSSSNSENSVDSSDTSSSTSNSGDTSSSGSTNSASVEDVYFNCVFQNYDDTVLYTTSVKQGETADYPYPNPTRDATDHYTYVFNSWNKPLTNIQKDTTFIAQYEYLVNQYTITFKNFNGSETLDSKTVDYGESVTYTGVTPTKQSTAQFLIHLLINGLWN